MINLETFLMGLLITSTLTGLVTEAFKNMFMDMEINYKPNILAGVIALILSTTICFCYIFATGMTFTPQVIVYLIAQVFMSWLCAMLGYDKVVQTIAQFKTTKNKD